VNLPKRAGALIALFVAAGVWVNSATPTAAPTPPVLVERAGPQPTLAPLPPVPVAPAAPAGATATEVEISYEIAPLPLVPVVVASPPKTSAPPAAKPAEKPQTNCQPSGCQYYYRRGFLRRR